MDEGTSNMTVKIMFLIGLCLGLGLDWVGAVRLGEVGWGSAFLYLG